MLRADSYRRGSAPPSASMPPPSFQTYGGGTEWDSEVSVAEAGEDGRTDVYSNSSTEDGGGQSGREARWMSSVSLNYSIEMMIVVCILLFVVIVITAVGNAMVGLALFRYRQLRTVSNYLIGNLALSDFLLAMTIFPLSTVNEALGYWPFGRTLCHFWLTVDVLCCTASIWNLCVIAFDRFTATVYPVWYRGRRSAPGCHAAIYAVVVWSVAAVVCVPPMLGWKAGELHQFDPLTGVYSCNLFDNSSYVIYSACGSFFVPFLVTLFFYLDILVVLRSRLRKPTGAAPAAAASRNNSTASRRLPAGGKAAGAGGGWLKNKTKATADNRLTTTAPKIELTDSFSSIIDAVAATAIENGDQSTSGGRSKVANDDSFYCLGDITDDKYPSASTGENSPRKLDEPVAAERQSSARPAIPMSLDLPAVRVSTSTEQSKEHGTSVSRNGSAKLTVPSFHHASKNAQTDAVTPDTDADPMLQPPVFSLKSSGSFCLSPFVRRKNRSPSVSGSAVELASPSTAPADDGAAAAARLRRQQRQQRASYERREMRATVRMAIIIAFFCCFWLGFFVVYVVRGCCSDCPIPRALDAFFFWLGYSNSSVNPILYTIFNEEFRTAFQKILGVGGRNGKNGRGNVGVSQNVTVTIAVTK